MKKQDRVGEFRYNNAGDKLEITAYTNNKNIEVTNTTTGEVYKMRYDTFANLPTEKPADGNKRDLATEGIVVLCSFFLGIVFAACVYQVICKILS